MLAPLRSTLERRQPPSRDVADATTGAGDRAGNRKYRPENTEVVTGVPAADVREAAKLLGRPNDLWQELERGSIDFLLVAIPIVKRGGRLVGTKRAYEDEFVTENGKANFVAREPELDRWRSACVPARGDQAQRRVPLLRHHRPLPGSLAVGLHLPLDDRARHAGPVPRDHDQPPRRRRARRDTARIP